MESSNVLKFSQDIDRNVVGELLKSIKNGNAADFGRLYDLFFPKIYRFIYYRVGHKETAEDLAEEVFLKVHSKIAGLVSEIAFEAWIYQIARNMVIDHYRKQKFTVALEDVENTLEYESNVIDVLSLEHDQKTLLKLLKNLSADEQALLKMKFFENLDNSSIAAILHKSEGAIRVMQHRAIAKLQKLLADNTPQI
jgi:RNA polymerase sigma-70 factor (ECF subfamily)